MVFGQKEISRKGQISGKQNSKFENSLIKLFSLVRIDTKHVNYLTYFHILLLYLMVIKKKNYYKKITIKSK